MKNTTDNDFADDITSVSQMDIDANNYYDVQTDVINEFRPVSSSSLLCVDVPIVDLHNKLSTQTVDMTGCTTRLSIGIT